MHRTTHIRLMANYNQWMNNTLFTASQGLSHEQLTTNQGAFFGSILGTLNHIAVGDTIWLKRFAGHTAKHPESQVFHTLPSPSKLNQFLFNTLPELSGYRSMLDAQIIRWVEAISDGDLDETVVYANMKGVIAHKNFFALLMHFFNHQTHHRGQVSTLLSQNGVDFGDTDLVLLIPDDIEC
ncbi:hypothetical protein DTO96_101036 [Ephemeroptericola cinctiostellae]|uniref:DinB family protein n=1 Tax=Ephemeroptericola cinctiostellae TaxID=2268024 RepID=A0A345DAB8_9BURK|nr:DinB family protein [Ephemeroptericola cinctiostellae]AXF85306.1 hypothetical protein DTO96_101036 [Ephemeroptericola cinctiostellae]